MYKSSKILFTFSVSPQNTFCVTLGVFTFQWKHQKFKKVVESLNIKCEKIEWKQTNKINLTVHEACDLSVTQASSPLEKK